ncbi:hypothetical protein R84B8_01370 [Treponema sp. R8-4-B8]
MAEAYKYWSVGDYRFNKCPDDRCSSCQYLKKISNDSDYSYQCTANTGSKAAELGRGKPTQEKCDAYLQINQETDEDRRRASGVGGGFLMKFLIISIIAFVGAEVISLLVMHNSFSIVKLLLRIPSAFVGYLVGWVFRWLLINIGKAATSDWRDKLFSTILPLLVALVAAIVVPMVIIK